MTATQPTDHDLHSTPGETRYDRVHALVHDALFYEDAEDGPVFRWADQRLVSDDGLVKLAANQVTNSLFARAPEVSRVLAGQRPPVARPGDCDDDWQVAWCAGDALALASELLHQVRHDRPVDVERAQERIGAISDALVRLNGGTP